MYCRIRLTCSDTWRTLAIPSSAPVFDLSPRANQVSMPGRTPLNELRLSRLRCGSESRDRLLSATKSMLLGGREVDARGPVLRAVPQDVTECTLIREAQHIVEVTRGVFGVTAGVRPPDRGDSPSRPEEITQGVRRVRG